MDDLLDQQDITKEKITKFESNYKKDGPTRKTKSYLDSKIEQLKALYTEYVNTDEQIHNIVPPIDKKHPYIDQRSTVASIYKKLIDDMRQRLDTAPQTPTPASSQEFIHQWTDQSTKNSEQTGSSTKNSEQTGSSTKNSKQTESSTKDSEQTGSSTKNSEKSSNTRSDQSSNTTLNQLLRRQDFKMRELYREIMKAKQVLEEQQGKQAMQFTMQYMQRAMNQIIDRHEELCVEASDDEQGQLGYFARGDYEALKEEYTSMAIKLTTAIEETSSNNAITSEIKLKPIDIPTFYGDYMKWNSFSEIFKKLIDQNQRLSDTHKINYLKNHLSGAAAKLIGHLESTADNYNTAWSILTNRYNNKRLIISAYLNTLLNQPSINAESAVAIRNMHDTTNECIHAIRSLGINVESWNSFLIFVLSKKLDNETRRLYESSLQKPDEFQETEEFLKFLEQRFKSLEASYNTKNQSQQPKTQTVKQTFAATTLREICVYCQMNHALDQCARFTKLSTTDKNQIVLLHQLCRRCLSSTHQTYHCTQNKRCSICNGIHHTILHTAKPKAQTSSIGEIKNFKLITTVNHDKEHVLLATAMVSANSNGRYITLRALIDPGSQATFITEEAVQRLKLKGQKVYAKIAGVGGQNIGEVKKIVNLKIQPVRTSEFELQLEALVFQKLTKLLPEQQIQTSSWEHLNNLEHADPNYNTPGSIDILLGADYYPKIILGDIVKGSPEQPIAQKTELGWIIFGKFKGASAQHHHIKSMISYIDLENQLKRFWEIEEVDPERELTSDEQRCEEHFKHNYERLENGAYQVALPFKNDEFILGESRRKATARLLQVEKQLNKNIQMKNQYKSFIEEYIELDHMVEISHLDDTGRNYFLPHHAVIKEDSSTTKLRVVFDASAKTSNGISLNDLLHTGPTIQQPLAEILLRWRKHKYVFKADIEKMFRQIKIRPQDQSCQMILWRNGEGTIAMHKLKTVTYGTASATYLATRVLHQLAQDDGDNYPAAKIAVTEDFYVDDILSGADTITQATAMQEQLGKLLRKGGFNLRKWSSNNHKILQDMNTEDRNENEHTIEIGETIKTLGILWNPTEDSFQFKIKPVDIEAPITKRKVLSETSKLFDPIGWLAPVIIKAKIIMQQLWTLGLDWDTELPTELQAKWICYTTQLQTLERVRLKRWLNHSTDNKGELHGFCDASEDAYAAVIYYKSTSTNQSKIILVTAKTKVAPLKSKLTIPRLELCAAVLLSKLIRKTKQALQEPNIKTFAWTDSMITLAWIRGKPNRFKTFVANRIVEIQSVLPPLQWGYVKSEENPADCASRGLNPTNLVDHSLWWNGPSWLRDSIEYTQQPKIEETTEESRNEVCGFTTTNKCEDVILKLTERCSTFTKAVRSLAYVLRFTKRTAKSSPSYLTTKEVQDSLKLILKVTQQFYFGVVDKQLGKQNESNLRTLNPIIDNDGLLRVGGRLSNARVNIDIQHPIIIPYKSHFTTLLIDYAHKMTLHGTKRLTLAFIRQKYWIIKGPLAVKAFINKCVVCYKQQARTLNQLMGDLPIARVTPSKPFTHSGVDYAGPFHLRCSPGRGNKSYKGYIAVFVCFAIKAVHLEAVSNLSSEAFLAAFKRFVARRGHCSDLYSDCGSNFIGASKILGNDLIAALKQLPENLAEQLVKDGTQWHYIPARAPHMGGLWEAAVKSVKHHLRRIIGDQHLTFEEMSTILCQIEACLNSRPLLPLTSDPNDFTTLTPGHFLVGEPLRTIPEPTHLNQNINHLARWRLLQRIIQEFWQIWQTDYILLLQKRSKWNKIERNLGKGELVLIKDEDLPPGKWPLGRIHEVHSGNDGLVRTVTVKTSNGGLLKRSVTKVSRLPIDDNDQCEEISLPEETQAGAAGDSDSTKQRKRVTRASGKSKLLLHTLAIICALGLVAAGPPTRCNISRFTSHPGIYFDKIGQGSLINGEWKVITYYNLTSYWAELNHLGKVAQQLGRLCSNGTLIKVTLVHSDTTGYCEAIVSQIKSLYAELNEQNDILTALAGNKITRKRRAPFDFIGTISNELFGVLDQREGRIYRENIEKLNSNQQLHKELLQNQISILESTINLMKHTHEETTQKFEAYNQILTTILFHEEFTDLAIHTILEMMKLRNFQAAIANTITEVHQGILNPLIITPHQLLEQIKQIIPYLKLNQGMPFRSGDIAAIYKTATVKTVKIETTVIFEIKIPLVQRTRYNIYHVMPIPTIRQQEYIYIRPSTNYLLIAIQENQYMRISSEELNTCTNFNDEYICDIHQPLNAYHSNTSSCEMQLFQHSNNVPTSCEINKMDITALWIPLRRHNAWIFVIKTKANFNVICESDSGTIETTTIAIEGEGILTLDPTCVLKGETVTLTGYRAYSSKLELSFMPQFNLSDQMNIDPSIQISRSSQFNQKFDAIEESIREHKQNLKASATAANMHDVHHYTMAYTIIGILLIAATCMCIKHKMATQAAGVDPLPDP